MSERIVKWASFLAVFALQVILFQDAWVSIFAPWPHRIGEGMMALMASDLSDGRSPYGDILAVPSVYACYGPLPSLMVSVVASLLPGPTPPEHFVWIGRLLSFIAWCVASISLVFIVRPVSIHPGVAGCIFLCVVSPFWSFWTFRTDSFVVAIEGLILLSMVRLPSNRLGWVLGFLGPALALTKIPAAVDIVPLVLLAACVRGRPLNEEVRRLTPGLAVGGISALITLLIVNAWSGGWMLDNIILTQLHSGKTTGEIFSACVNFALYGRQSVILWIGVVAACFARRSGSLFALAASLLTCGVFATKDGADYNYYLPFLFIATVVSIRELDMAGRLTWVALMLPFMVLPLGGSLHRADKEEITLRTRHYESVLALHRNPQMLSDDPYYSLMAGSKPLATDLFQLSRVLSSKGISQPLLISSATAGWGGEFMWTLLGGRGETGRQLTSPLPHANSQGAVHFLDPSSLARGQPPTIERGDALFPLYLRKLGILALFLTLAAIIPIAKAADSRESSIP